MERRLGYQYFGGLGLYYVHGRWYDPNVGRFISPDEKGEYLYGSGEDAVNYVRMYFRGAQCQFANNEVLGGFEFSDRFADLVAAQETWYGAESYP